MRTIEATTDLECVLVVNTGCAEADNSPSDSPMPPHALKALSNRISLERPKMLASSIAAAIDEDGLMQSHRIEESDGADIVTLARDVLQREGSEEDLNALSGVVRSKAPSKILADSEFEETETWIMRKT